MSFFNARLRYALCAVVDLALQPPLQSCQSREIATRQGIPGPYLDQILAALKSAGIVRSVRGAGGGYNLSRSPSKITAGEIVRAMMRGDQLFARYAECCRAGPPAVYALTLPSATARRAHGPAGRGALPVVARESLLARSEGSRPSQPPRHPNRPATVHG